MSDDTNHTNEEHGNDSTNPFSRFPEMRPVKRAPGLGTVNGIGTTLVGSRDYDEETGTHVKTYCFSVIFIPILALSAYRVFDSPDGNGWYFIGRVPLSPFARAWNWLFSLLVLGGIGVGAWVGYTGTEGYKAGQQLAQADRLAAEGEHRKAAEIYRTVMLGPTEKSAAARQKLQDLIASPPAEDLAQAAGVFELARDLHRQNVLNTPDLYDRAVKLIGENEQRDPKGALALLDAVAPMATKPGEALPVQRRLLERLVEEKPDDVQWASRLAVVYEELGEPARCEAILLPHEARLGDRDGAAILGRVLAAKGEHARALRLLDGFLTARLPGLRAAEQAYATALQSAHQSVLAELNQGRAAGFDFTAFRALDKEKQDAEVNRYIFSRLREDPGFVRAQEGRMKQRAVVTAAMDLGTVRLQMAQRIADPEVRRDGLKKAEETFLLVRSQAGQSDEYRLRLGQVYYWLGKHGEGKKLFDDVLAQHKREAKVLMGVARLLREVGAVSEARALAEEAHRTASDAQVKQHAAGLRAVMHTDLEDEITWLEKTNTSLPEVKATLSHAQGRKALQDNNEEAAAKHFREALAVYAKMPDNAATLNNSALVHLSLFGVTGEREELQRGMEKLDRAISLEPGDSILLSNAAGAVMEAALRDLVGGQIDLKVLKRGGDSWGLLAYLYRDEAGKEALWQKVRKHPGYLKARAYHEKLLVLAPKRPESYRFLQGAYAYANDAAGLRSLLDRLKDVTPDQDQENKETLEVYSGKKDARLLEDAKKAATRQDAILKGARKVGGVTLAVALNQQMAQHQALGVLGQPVDADRLVKWSEEADRVAPSAATQTGLISALCFRAHREMIRTDPGYKAQAEKTTRSLGPQLLLLWALSRPEGEMRRRALALADVKTIVELTRKQAGAFPKGEGVRTWALLEAAGAREEAAEVRKSIEANPCRPPRRALDAALSPLSSSVALDAYLGRLMEGKAVDEADGVLAEYARKGVPLPAVAKK